MAETRCERCKGTGYANVARDSGMEDLPMLLQPIGVFRCTNCCGSGRVGISDEAMELLRNAIKQWRAKPSNAKSEPTARLFVQVGSTDGLCHTGDK